MIGALHEGEVSAAHLCCGGRITLADDECAFAVEASAFNEVIEMGRRAALLVAHHMTPASFAAILGPSQFGGRGFVPPRVRKGPAHLHIKSEALAKLERAVDAAIRAPPGSSEHNKPHGYRRRAPTGTLGCYDTESCTEAAIRAAAIVPGVALCHEHGG